MKFVLDEDDMAKAIWRHMQAKYPEVRDHHLFINFVIVPDGRGDAALSTTVEVKHRLDPEPTPTEETPA